MTRAGAARTAFAIVQVFGGVAVLGSYAHSIASHPEPSVLWGTLPEAVIPFYTGFMPLAAVGYLVATWFVWRRVDPSEVDVAGIGYGWFVGAAGILTLASALWMPLSLAAHDAQAGWLWWWIQVDLAATATASLAFGWGLWTLRPSSGRRAWTAAMVGWTALCWQTVVLDCLIWPRFFVV